MMYDRRGDRDEAGIRTIWVEALPNYVDESFLTQKLKGLGIIRYKVNARPHNPQGDKYAFLEFDNRESAARFMDSYNGRSLPGIQGISKLDFADRNSRGGRGGGGGERWGGGSREDEKDNTSIFVGELSDDVTEEYLMSVFSTYFPSTRSAKIVRNPATGLSRGFAFVRFSDEADRERALNTMHGFLIGNRPIRVRSATGKNEPPPREAFRHETNLNTDDGNHATLFIGNVSSSISEDQLRSVFSAYGPVIYARIPPGRHCGFVQMESRTHAEAALNHAHGSIVGGQPIRVAWGKSNQSSAHSHSQPQQNYLPSGYENYQGYSDPNAYYAGTSYSYDQPYQEPSTPTEIPGIGPWHQSLSKFAKHLLDEKAVDTELSTSAANAEYLLRNQTSILGPLQSVPPV